MGKLDGKVAVVTGGNSGIGLATVKLFLAEGAKVVLTGRRQEALDEVSATLKGEFLAYHADAADPAASAALIKKTVDHFGKIDILFLNAGIAPFMPITDITEAHFDEIFNINVKGPFFTIKEAVPFLNDSAVIITNTSVVNQKGFPGTSVYSASKAALRSVSRVLANELAEKKVRTVSVAPGPIDTPIYGKIGLPEEQVQAMGESFSEIVPLSRFGTSEELAKTVLFLASDDSSYVNGIEIAVDGGLSQV
ncbi:MAG: glucose 1-dehydrogenase [Cyclobacteriaceae bacterium]|nr:glucose 1-dehydrogenase [Cyclobacteriaceae bacterium HetDA_MAG_MS6]